MSYLALARKWRPRSFDQMVGQEHVRRALAHALDSDRVHHAFLFTGTRGVGKTTVARILAKALNCERGPSSAPCGECTACRDIDAGRFVDLLEVDAASRTKVDETRELLDNVQYTPAGGRYKIYLIDEVHMLSAHSFNALLKTLEEPPPHVKFLLATTDPQKIPATVLSRCLQFNLKPLPAALIAERLVLIAAEEGIEVEPGAIELLAQAADGSMRDALSLLDQVSAFGGGRLAEADVRTMLGMLERDRVVSLLGAVAEGDGARLVAELDAIAEHVPDYGRSLDEIAGLLQRAALLQAVPQAGERERWAAPAVRQLAQSFGAEELQLCYQIAVLGRRDLPLAPDPRSGFEMVLLRMLAFRPADGAPMQAPPGAPGSDSVVGERRRPAAEAVEAAPGWEALLERLDLQGATRQLAANCALIRRQGGRFELRLDPRSSHLHTRQLEEKLRIALERHLGEPVRLAITVDDPGETPARRTAREQETRQRAAQRSIEQDPNVQALIQTFDATLQPDSVQHK